MKSNFIFLLLFVVTFTFAQNSDKIIIPKGVVYNYVENNINEKATIQAEPPCAAQ